MVIGEPERELVTFSFWAKMTLVATGTVIALVFSGLCAPAARTGRTGWGPTRR